MNITPLPGYVIVRPYQPISEPVLSPGGIWITRHSNPTRNEEQFSLNQGTLADPPRTGIVVALSKADHNVKLSDRVLLAPQCGSWIGSDLICVRESDLRAIVAYDAQVASPHSAYPGEVEERRPW